MVPSVGDQVTVRETRMQVVEVQSATDSGGAFAFDSPQCSLTVQRIAGDPLGPVSGDDHFCAYVLQGIDDTDLWGIGFGDAEYGEMVSVPQALPIDQTFTMAWQAGQVIVSQDGTLVSAGMWVEGAIGVAGAGTEAVIGIYEPNGTYGGLVRYTKITLDYEVWYDTGSGTWVLSASAGTLPPLYARTADDDPPLTATGAWSYVTGAPDPPTVTLAPNDGGSIDVVLVRVYPETLAKLKAAGDNEWEDARNYQVYLPPNSAVVANRTYVTDDDAIIRWVHPEEGEILPRFPKGHRALGQRLTDPNPFTGEDPNEYTEQVRAYYKGVYTLLEEGKDKEWDIVGGTITVTVPAGHYALVRPQNWLATGAWIGGADSGEIAGPDTVTLRALPVGIPFNVTWFRVSTLVPIPAWDYNYQAKHMSFAVVEGATSVDLATCDTPYSGQMDGFVFKEPGTPLAGAPIFVGDFTLNSFYQVATTDANGYWTVSGLTPGGFTAWLYDETWGTVLLCPALSCSSWACVGARVMSGYWGAWSASENTGEANPAYVFTLPHVPYLPGAVTVQRLDGASVVDTWETKEGAWGGWQTKEVIPACKYQVVTPGSTPATTYYSFRYISGGTTSGTANTEWEQPWNAAHPSGQGHSSGHLRIDCLGGIIGGKVHGNLLREKARKPIDVGLEEARRMGMEHGLWQPPMRTLWLPEENDDNQYAASAIGRECPYCHGQALIEPGTGAVTGLTRGWCWQLHSDDACGGVPVPVDARMYFESYPTSSVDLGHFHLLYSSLGLRRYHGKNALDPLTYWYRPDAYEETPEFLRCWLSDDAGITRWVAVHRWMARFVFGAFTAGATSATVLTAYGQSGVCGLRPKLVPLGALWQAEASYEIDLLHLDATTQTITAHVSEANEDDPVFLLPRHFTKAESRGWRAAGLVDAVTAIRQVSGGNNNFQVVVDPPAVFDAGIPIVNQTRTPYVLPWLPLGGGVKTAVAKDDSIWVAYNDSENIMVRHMRAPWTDYSAAVSVADGVEYEVADIECRGDGWLVVHCVRNSDSRLCAWHSLDGVTWTGTGPL